MSQPNTIFDQLSKPFPEDEVKWRAQSLTKDGKKAMALCYVDARAVQDRLDGVLGMENWQRDHKPCGDGKLACGVGIKIDNEWIWKWDGAGDTQVEADKGAFSDSFKRACVNFGIARYLYDREVMWVSCESYEQNGKMKFKKFTAEGLRMLHGEVPERQLDPDVKPTQQPKKHQQRWHDKEAEVRPKLDKIEPGMRQTVYASWLKRSQITEKNDATYAQLVDLHNAIDVAISEQSRKES